jgi:hypothetical protein
MSRPDINLLSFTGPEQNNQTLQFSDEEVRPGPEIADTLKFTSRLTNFTVYLNTVYGGREDCVDVNNHSENLHIYAKLWVPQGKYLATIKGGSKFITLGGKVRGHGKEVDVDIGNISDQSTKPTGPVYLNLTHEKGEPITVRVLNGEKPKFLNAQYQEYVIVFKTPSFFGKLFANIIRQLRKIGLA